MSKPRVFVVCEPVSRKEGVSKIDLSPASEYGEIEVLLAHTQSLYAPVPTIRKLREKLSDFCDEDYVLPVGDPVLMSTVSMVAAEMNQGRVAFLKWDRIQRRYIVIRVDTSGDAT
jgi:hypothetical protein